MFIIVYLHEFNGFMAHFRRELFYENVLSVFRVGQLSTSLL